MVGVGAVSGSRMRDNVRVRRKQKFKSEGVMVEVSEGEGREESKGV